MRGELKKASDLFEKYRKTLIAPEGAVIREFLVLVEDLFGIKVPKHKISYNPTTKTLVLTGVGALRSEIKLREEEVLTHLKARLGEKNAPKRVI